MKNILVVCIGNICRSPMAEAMLKRALPDSTIKSAGLGALIGMPADPLAVQLLIDEGLDIRGHVAQQISAALVSEAELVLVMDHEQRRFIENKYIGARGKIFRLGELSNQDVPDPYRGGITEFALAKHLIQTGVDAWSQRILRMS